MKIVITVTGGWSGLRSECVVDTATLGAAQAARVEQAFALCAAAAVAAPAPGARDSRTYVVENAALGRVVRITESSAPPQAADLLRMLRPFCCELP